MRRANSITYWSKRITLVGIVSLASIAAANAQIVPKVPKGIDSCKLLRDAGRGSAVMAHTGYVAAGSHWMSCEYIDTVDALKAQWRASFGFVPWDSAARAEKDWQTSFDIWKKNETNTSFVSISVSRLRGFGADDAFVVEIVNRDSGSREAKVYWRKGTYSGTLQLHAPLESNLADIEDAEEIFKAIRWAAFGK